MTGMLIHRWQRRQNSLPDPTAMIRYRWPQTCLVSSGIGGSSGGSGGHGSDRSSASFRSGSFIAGGSGHASARSILIIESSLHFLGARPRATRTSR